MSMSFQDILGIAGISVSVLIFIMGGIASLIVGLLCYIFNSKVKEIDNRVSNVQENCHDGMKTIIGEVEKMRENHFDQLDAITRDVNDIKRDITEVKTLMHERARREDRER